MNEECARSVLVFYSVLRSYVVIPAATVLPLYMYNTKASPSCSDAVFFGASPSENIAKVPFYF